MVREKDISRAYQTVVRGAVLPRVTPGSRLGDAHFEEVARVYRLALEKRERPTKAVKDTFHVGPSAAGRYVQEARRRGMLRDAPAPFSILAVASRAMPKPPPISRAKSSSSVATLDASGDKRMTRTSSEQSVFALVPVQRVGLGEI